MSAPAAPGAAPLLDVTGLDVAYGDFQVLWQAALRVREGEIVAVLGPNGSGKTTLCDALSGFGPSAGRVYLGERDVSSLAAHHRSRLIAVTCLESRPIGEGRALAEQLALAGLEVRLAADVAVNAFTAYCPHCPLRTVLGPRSS